MKPCDVIYFSGRSSANDIVQGRHKLWRHVPLRGMGYSNARGVGLYLRWNEWRYGRCRVQLRWWKPQIPLRNDRNCRSAVKDESQFRATVRRSNVIRSLVSLLSNRYLSVVEKGNYISRWLQDMNVGRKLWRRGRTLTIWEVCQPLMPEQWKSSSMTTCSRYCGQHSLSNPPIWESTERLSSSYIT